MTTIVATPPSAETSGTDRSVRQRSQGKTAWGFLTPFGFFYLAFLIGPTIYMIIASFFNTSLVRSGLGSYAGLGNYKEMLGRQDFRDSIWHTLQFTLYTTPPLVIIAFIMAVLVNRMRRGQGFYRMAFFLPFVLPSTSIALIWTFIYSQGTGLLATVQGWFGDTNPAPVLASPTLAMVGIAVATLWWTIGFNFVLYLAALQDIPRELYEAAAVDGATPWAQIWRITVPLLSRTTTLVILLQIIASLKIFDQVYLMTQGGPGQSTQVALLLITNTAFTSSRVGAASAASVLLFLMIIVIAVIRQLVTVVQERRS